MMDKLKKQPDGAEAPEMKPEPMLIVNGMVVSDWPLHADMLNNEEANQRADIFAMHIAVELGFTPEEAIKMCGGRFTLDSERSDHSLK
jgi:hypothetical protein